MNSKLLTLKKLKAYLWPKNMIRAKIYLISALFSLFIGRICVLGGPVIFKYLIDEFEKHPASFPFYLLVGFVAMRIFAQIFNELRDYIFNIVTQRVFREISVTTFKHLHSLSLNFHLNRQTGGLSRIIERATKSLEMISQFLMMTILPSFIETLLLSVLLWVWYGPWCSLIMISTMLVYVVFTINVATRRLKIVKQMNSYDNSAHTRTIDSLLNFETVKYFNNEDFETKRYDEIQAFYEETSRKLKGSLNLLNAGQAIIFSLGLGGMLGIAINRAALGEITAGDIAALFAFSLQLVMPLFNLGFAYREIKQGMVNLGEMFDLLDQDSDIKDAQNAQALVYKKGKIVFENVSFSYGSDRHILKNISFEIQPGETVAFVGETGAGKSTLSRLLFRFYDPSQGRILIDGQDIKSVTQKSLRKILGMVPQDTVLFNDTLGYNIAYADSSASFEQVQEAAQNAELGKFIAVLPEGLNTTVGERGLKLSGGEKQRVSIARALLKQPKIFIFDEATSALDTATEKRIHETLQKISKNHTTIIIAHRLSTIVNAAKVFVLNKGVIAESGTHHELLQQKGLYEKLWNQQIKQELEA
ncbi:MAG: ABC transporter ATP-binding protein/permease [Proteobacteria bacterium]|nr:ABC transporter ATP-binding protein/permease [Pseudomonadota bacterium]